MLILARADEVIEMGRREFIASAVSATVAAFGRESLARRITPNSESPKRSARRSGSFERGYPDRISL